MAARGKQKKRASMRLVYIDFWSALKMSFLISLVLAVIIIVLTLLLWSVLERLGLTPERAAWLAQRWARRAADGQWHLLADAAHKMANPYPYRLEEAQAVWGNVSAPVLHVEATESDVLQHFAGAQGKDVFRARFEVFPNLTEAFVADAGHMLHHDQPEEVARLIDDFCAT